MLASAIATSTFQELGISVSVSSNGVFRAIHLAPDSLLEVEVEHQAEFPRWRYNTRCIREACTTGRSVLGEHRGTHDWFVPVGGPNTVLVAGPFLLRPSTRDDVVRRWRAVSHGSAHVTDPAFSRYLSMTFATPTLPGALSDDLRRLLGCLAQALRGQGDAQRLTRQSDALAERLWVARLPERAWDAVRGMVDDRTCHVWRTPLKRDPLARLGMKGPP